MSALPRFRVTIYQDTNGLTVVIDPLGNLLYTPKPNWFFPIARAKAWCRDKGYEATVWHA
jgi:hypothetical protein